MPVNTEASHHNLSCAHSSNGKKVALSVSRVRLSELDSAVFAGCYCKVFKHNRAISLRSAAWGTIKLPTTCEDNVALCTLPNCDQSRSVLLSIATILVRSNGAHVHREPSGEYLSTMTPAQSAGTRRTRECRPREEIICVYPGWTSSACIQPQWRA